MAAPTLQQKFDAFRDTALRNRIQVVCVEQAKTIFLEDPGTPNHAQRLAWAKDAATFDGGAIAAKQMQSALVEIKMIDPKVTPAEITDADVRSGVATLVDKFAV